MTETELTGAVAGLPADGPLRARGIHLHVGSQLGAVDAWRDAVRRGLAVLALIGAGRVGFDTFDVGGGFPVGDPGTVPTPEHFGREARALIDALPVDRRPARLAVEPGRFLVAEAGWLVARVLHVRERADAERIVVLDTGMTELIRPALYGASHPIRALTSLGRPLDGEGRTADGATIDSTEARIDGPICESTDTFDRHRLPPLRRGDLVAIGEAGAYAASMAMTYNGRPAAPQVLLEPDGRLALGRRRTTARFRSSGTTG
jgi:diaminopimelate decarboxylase